MTTPPPKSPERQSRPDSANRDQPPIDAVEAARLAGLAIGAGREGLRAAWRKGKAAAAARGVTEESVRRTVERGRTVAVQQAREQARRRGLGGTELPKWPGSFGGSTAERPTGQPDAAPGAQTAAGTTAQTSTGATAERARPAQRPAPPRAAPSPSPARSTAGLLGGAARMVLPGLGRRRFGLFPAGAVNSAAIERRLAAFAIDLALFGVAFILLIIIMDLLGAALFGGSAGGDAWLGLALGELLRVSLLLELRAAFTGGASATVTIAQIVQVLALSLYMVASEAAFGRTAGKRLLGLRVVSTRRGEERIGLKAAAIRNFCRAYDISIPLWPLAVLDLLLILITRRRQRSGDWLAETMVIDERRGA